MYIKILFITALFILSFSLPCCSQPLLKSLDDLSKLKRSAKKYEGKSLSFFLKDIGVPIIWFTTRKNTPNPEQPNYFNFRFHSSKAADSLAAVGIFSGSIVVYVKEQIVLDYNTRPQETKFNWTKEDEKNFGNLTVAYIRVIGAK